MFYLLTLHIINITYSVTIVIYKPFLINNLYINLSYICFVLIFRNKSPKKQGKGVEIRKEKPKVTVKPSMLKKEGEKVKVDASSSSLKKNVQQELWSEAIGNVSTKSTLSDEESCIVKLLANYKTQSSIPQKKIKFKVFIYFIINI